MPTLENYQRAEALRKYVRQEVEDFRAGRVPRLSNFAELSERFGYGSYNTSRTILATSGLLEERTSAEQNRFGLLTPSTELAWMIGILSGGGYVGRTGEISLRSDVPELLDTFESRGETIFGLPAQRTERSKKSGWGTIVTKDVVAFYNTTSASALGDLSRNNWSSTVINKHRWILEHGKYSWKLIEGFFEKRGTIYGRTAGRGTKGDCILLTTSSPEGANFLSELCERLGIENPTIRKFSKPIKGVQGVTINRSVDINVFANNVYPISPDKEALLSNFRDRVVRRGRTILYSEQEVIEEWTRLAELLGYEPSLGDLKRLKQQGVSKYSPAVFINRFGQGSWSKARETLKALTTTK